MKIEIRQNNIRSFEELKKNIFFKNLVWQTLKPRTEIIAKSKIPCGITSVEDFVQQGALILFENVLEKYEVGKKIPLINFASTILSSELYKHSRLNSSALSINTDFIMKMDKVNKATNELFNTLQRYPSHLELMEFLGTNYQIGKQAWENFFVNWENVRLAMPGQYLNPGEADRLDLAKDNASLLQEMQNNPKITLDKVFEIVGHIETEIRQNQFKEDKIALPLHIQINAFKTYLIKLLESKNQIVGQTEIAKQMSEKYQIEIKQYQISRNNEKWFGLVKMKFQEIYKLDFGDFGF